MQQGISEVGEGRLQSLNELLLMVVETMYRGMDAAPVARVVFLIRETVEPTLRYRCGLGADLAGAAEWFRVPLDGSGNIFRLAESQKKDLALPDVSVVGLKAAYPTHLWSRMQPAGYVIVLPLVIRDKVIGAFFIEGSCPRDIEPEQLKLLKSLRDQVAHRIDSASMLAA